MHNNDLVSSFAEIAREKGLDRAALQLKVEDSLRAMIKKRYGADDSFEIIFNPDHGDIQIIHIQEVVQDWDVEDPVTQIAETKAQEIDEDFEMGEEVATEVALEDFGRRAVMTLRQTLRQSIRDFERDRIFDQYSELVGEIVVGEIYQVRRRDVYVLHDEVELILPQREQIRRERYHKGEMLRAIVKEVEREGPGGNPQIILSRADPLFMERLFEVEVPEIYDGIVEIKKVVREPGERAKMAVVSHDERIDPVGACVGMKGVRIHAIVRELAGENVDVLPWSPDPFILIKRALSPANPLSVTINDDLDPPRAKAVVQEDEVSQAIGRGGVNIRLASRLAGYEIDVYREILEEEEDIDISEFDDELQTETVMRLQEIGCDTARQVLELSLEELKRRTGFEHERAEFIHAVIEAEFAREEEPPEENLEGEASEEDAGLEALGTAPSAGAAAADALEDEEEPITLGEAADTEPVAEEADTEPIAEETDTEPVAEAADTEPLADEADAEVIADEADAEPRADEANTAPLADEVDTAPVTDEEEEAEAPAEPDEEPVRAPVGEAASESEAVDNPDRSV